MRTKSMFRISCMSMLLVFASMATKAQDVPVETPPTPFDTLAANVSTINDQIGLMKKLSFSGYIQAQYQMIDSVGQNTFNGGDFAPLTDNRIMLRRARLKATYNGTNSQYVFQIDATEGGFAIKDMYMKYTVPYLSKIFSFTIGNQNRPFGYEIGYSSTQRESPERARMSQLLFNGERDLGAMMTIQAPKTMPLLHAFKLEAGFFNGGGSGVAEFDKQKDFIGHLSFNKTIAEKISIGAGVSYYDGAWRQGSKNVYSMGEVVTGVNGFVVNSDSAANFNSYNKAKRQYMGADLQVSVDWALGLTTLRGEYIQGQQPSVASAGPKGTANPTSLPSADLYVRNFSGAYFYFVQNILNTKHQVCVKYDFYDPNMKVTGTDIAATINTKSTKLTASDVKYSTLGLGYAYKATENVKVTLFYEQVKNEKTLITKYDTDRKDNLFTCRVQYKF